MTTEIHNFYILVLQTLNKVLCFGQSGNKNQLVVVIL